MYTVHPAVSRPDRHGFEIRDASGSAIGWYDNLNAAITRCRTLELFFVLSGGRGPHHHPAAAGTPARGADAPSGVDALVPPRPE